MRVGAILKLLVIAVIGIHFRSHVHGAHTTIDYVGLAAAAAASWFGVPGPGEPVLIAAGVVAAKHKLDISGVIFIAFIGANAGGIGGWLAGMSAGRPVMERKGPLLRLRLAALKRGDHVFARAPVIAVFLAPSWVAGIHRVGPAMYLPMNALGAAVWATGIGLGAYYAGPPVVDVASDAGVVSLIALGVLVVGVIALDARRRRRKRKPVQE